MDGPSWSSWAPPRSNTCSTNLVQQSRTRTRSCNSSPSSCRNCSTTETQHNFTMGLGYTTCNSICSAWNNPPWLPNPNTICRSTPFTQTRTRTRNCGTKPPCVGGPCGTARAGSQNAYGTKTDPCDGSGGLCGSWGAYSSWHPAQNTICTGSSFKQSRSRSRTCDKSRGSCNYDAHCPRTDTAHKNVTGTKTVTCNDICGGWSNPPWSRDAGSVCVNVSFNRHRTNQRNCYPGCTISPSCKSIKYESGTAMGTKTFNDAKCDAVCGSWVTGSATPPKRAWKDGGECRTGGGNYSGTANQTRTCPALVDTCGYACKTSRSVTKSISCSAVAKNVRMSCIISKVSAASGKWPINAWISCPSWTCPCSQCNPASGMDYIMRSEQAFKSNKWMYNYVDPHFADVIEDIKSTCAECTGSNCYTVW